MTTVKIKSKKYHVLFSMRALSAFEEVTGHAIAGMDLTKMTLKQLAQLCVEGLRAGGDKAGQPLTPEEDVEWYIDCMDNDPKLLTNVVDAFIKQNKKK